MLIISAGEESACIAGDVGVAPGSGRSPGGGQWQPTPVFLPKESHGQRSLVGCSPWGHTESDVTEQRQQRSKGSRNLEEALFHWREMYEHKMSRAGRGRGTGSGGRPHESQQPPPRVAHENQPGEEL